MAHRFDSREDYSEVHQCSACRSILVEPAAAAMLRPTSCCGSHLCEACIEEAGLRESSAGACRCPMCGAAETSSVPLLADKQFSQELTKFSAESAAARPEWAGEMVEPIGHQEAVDVAFDGDRRSKHLPGGRSNRPMASEELRRKSPTTNGWTSGNEGSSEDGTSDVVATATECEYCGGKEEDSDETNPAGDPHRFECIKYPVECPNGCGEGPFPRLELAEHTGSSGTCAREVVGCPLSELPLAAGLLQGAAGGGCKARMARKDLPLHLQENAGQHLAIVMAALQSLSTTFRAEMEAKDKQIRELQATALGTKTGTEMQNVYRSLYGIEKYLMQNSPEIFTVTLPSFSRWKPTKTNWFSRPFYTHPGCYRMCLKVFSKTGSHISLFVCIMEGEFDQQLKWPLSASITVQLLNQRGDMGHFTNTRKGMWARVTSKERERGTGFGWPEFFPCYRLGYDPTKDTEYLRYDCLQFRVVSVDTE